MFNFNLDRPVHSASSYVDYSTTFAYDEEEMEMENLESKVDKFFQDNRTLLTITSCFALGNLVLAAVFASSFLFGASAMAGMIFFGTVFTGFAQEVDFSDLTKPAFELSELE